jgi:hypothetical protein
VRQDIGDLRLQPLELVAGLGRGRGPFDRQAGGLFAGGAVKQARLQRVLDTLKARGYRRNPAGRDTNEAELGVVDDNAHHDLNQRPFGTRITPGLKAGPVALSGREAAAMKQFASPVAGHADIPLLSDLEADNMLARNLGVLADADAAGIGGACVLMVFTRLRKLGQPRRQPARPHRALRRCRAYARAWRRRRQYRKLAELLSDAGADFSPTMLAPRAPSSRS